MLKIACIAKGKHPGTLGGIESFQRNLNKILTNCEFKVYAFSPKKEIVFPVPNLITIGEGNFLDKLALKILGRKRLLKIQLKKWNPDIIIINSANDLKFLKDLKAKIILVQHGSFDYYMDGTFNKEEVLNLIRKRLDRYVFLSPLDVGNFNKFLKLEESKVTSIRHICNVDLKKESKEKKGVLVMLSRLNREKRIDLVIKAMKKLPDFSLKIYGDGEEKENLKKLIKDLNSSNIELMGKTSKVKEAFDETGIFVLSSSNFEGYPIASIEAMRRGLPIILRNNFGSAEDIVQGNGVLLGKDWNEDEFVEAVKIVYNNYEKYSEKSLELGKRHNIDVIKKEWEKLFEELVK